MRTLRPALLLVLASAAVASQAAVRYTFVGTLARGPVAFTLTTGSLITTTTTIPLMAGLWHGPRGQKVVTPFSMMTGSLVSVSSLFWWAAIKQTADQTYRAALYQVFFVA